MKKNETTITLTEEEQARKKRYGFIDKVLAVVVCLGVFFALYTNFCVATVPTLSMYPTIDVDEFVLIDKISDPVQDLEHGDIVMFRYQESDGSSENLLKRLIGKPGDTIKVMSDGVYLNGEKLTEPYRPDPTTTATMDEITLGDNEFFVMGDNWNNSVDSRFFGPIDGSQLVGKSVFHCNPFHWFESK